MAKSRPTSPTCSALGIDSSFAGRSADTSSGTSRSADRCSSWQAGPGIVPLMAMLRHRAAALADRGMPRPARRAGTTPVFVAAMGRSVLPRGARPTGRGRRDPRGRAHVHARAAPRLDRISAPDRPHDARGGRLAAERDGRTSSSAVLRHWWRRSRPRSSISGTIRHW